MQQITLKAINTSTTIFLYKQINIQKSNKEHTNKREKKKRKGGFTNSHSL